MNKIFKAQVAGAFYKEGLGEIDLVWGEITDFKNHKGYGLSHILDKRAAEFMQEGLSKEEAEEKAEELIGKIPSIVENGKVVDLGNGKIRIVTDDYTIGMKNEWHDKLTNPYILTTFENNKKSDKNLHSTAFTKGETLPLNSNPHSIINNPDANTIIKKLKDYPLDNHMNIKEDEINNLRKDLERQLNINPIKEFGKNYAEYYQDGKGAIKKLINEYKEFERFNQKLKKGHKKRLDARHLTLLRS